jgi:hypothetical protein
MADTAPQIQYRQEFIYGFEQRQSLLRETVTTEAVIKGNQAVFLVADSGGSSAVTRGTNGMIPRRADDQDQLTATLGEWHDLAAKTGFNIFASQGNQRQMMQETTMAVMNRKIDSQIITELNTGTVTAGGSTTIPGVDLFSSAQVKLSNASVPWDSNITLLCQPSFLAYLQQTTEFSSADFVNVKPFAGNDANWRDRPMAYRWNNALIISHPGLSGRGTSSEISYMFHKAAIGHAVNTGGMESEIGYNAEQAYSWARCTMYMGAKLLQNSGVVVITADGSAYA